MNNQKLIGAWQLSDYQVSDQYNEHILLWGIKAAGLLIYLSNGIMSVQVSGSSRPVFTKGDFQAGSIDEIKCAFEGYTAYFGRYEYQEKNGLVLHHVHESLFPNWNGVTHTRYVYLDQNKLTLRTPPIPIKGELCTMQLHWLKVD